MDTKTFDELSPEDYKKQTVANWSKAPCGSNYSQSEFMSKEYFDGVEEYRYRTHGWIKEFIDSFDIAGKDILEIGFGMATDHVNMARRGAKMHGIDMTPRNLEVATARLALEGLSSDLITGDAENLPFPDESMDFVYSFGVIHHSPNTEKIISEIHRVLKPGGKCFITVYHKNSIFFWWTVFMVTWLFNGDYKRETLKQRLSRIEYPNDNPNMVIKLYKKKEFADMFSAFSKVQPLVRQLTKDCILVFGKYFPEWLLKPLGRRFGWYVVINATK